MFKKNIRILGTGSSLGRNLVTNEALERKLDLDSGWIESNCGVLTRYHAIDEEASDLGADASLKALKEAGLTIDDIDLIIGCSGVPQQAIPCFAALVHKKLGMKKTPAFDANSTCLSFITGLSIAAELIASNQYQHILLVSGDLATCGLNPKDPKTATLFGDGAAATILGPSHNTSSSVYKVHFETWSEKQESCLLEAGGSKLHNKELSDEDKFKNYFQMDGRTLIKIALPYAIEMIEHLLTENNISFNDLRICIPHQTSPLGMNLLCRKLQNKYADSPCHVIDIVKQFGNMIATSIPHALDYSINQGLLKRGDKALLIGTSAGISIGGTILEY